MSALGFEEPELAEPTVSDLTPLAGLKELRELALAETKVSDLTPLAGLKKLGELSLYGTQVSGEQVQMLKEALPNCQITR